MGARKIIVTSLFLFLLFSQKTFSQGIKFEKVNWGKIVKKAQRQHKFIFLQLQSEQCLECNEVAEKAFTNENLGNYFNQRFISVRLDGTKGEGSELSKKFSVNVFPVSLFLNDKEQLLYRYNGSTNNIQFYINYANTAISRKDAEPLATFEKEYTEGNRQLVFLESYILKRNEMNISTDSLLEEYVSILPKDSLQSFRVIQFIFGEAPAIYSKAYNAMHYDNAILERVYKTAGYQKASEVNNRIIIKSRQKAIEEKDINIAFQTARFVRGTWGNDKTNGQKGYDFTMLEYYKGIKDTAKFIYTLGNYYDRYYMSKNLDSLKSAEEEAFQQIMKTVPGDTIQTDKGIEVRKRVRTNSTQFEYGNSLNSGAWDVYTFATSKEDLERGLKWAKRALDYRDDDPASMDTYAHLLFKLGQKEEAKIWEQKAIDNITIQRKGMGIKTFEEALNKMKNNTLLIPVN